MRPDHPAKNRATPNLLPICAHPLHRQFIHPRLPCCWLAPPRHSPALSRAGRRWSSATKSTQKLFLYLPRPPPSRLPPSARTRRTGLFRTVCTSSRACGPFTRICRHDNHSPCAMISSSGPNARILAFPVVHPHRLHCPVPACRASSAQRCAPPFLFPRPVENHHTTTSPDVWLARPLHAGVSCRLRRHACYLRQDGRPQDHYTTGGSQSCPQALSSTGCAFLRMSLTRAVSRPETRCPAAGILGSHC